MSSAPSDGDVELRTISYMSTAVRRPSSQQIDKLLEGARARNEKEGVTGLLLYAGGAFHQYIEGPTEGLLRVFDAIKRDPMHHHILELINEPIERREFAAWPMAYRGFVRDRGSAEEKEIEMLLSDESPRLPSGRLLLNAFWTHWFGFRC